MNFQDKPWRDDVTVKETFNSFFFFFQLSASFVQSAWSGKWKASNNPYLIVNVNEMKVKVTQLCLILQPHGQQSMEFSRPVY